jgi:hypothetical protein
VWVNQARRRVDPHLPSGNVDFRNYGRNEGDHDLRPGTFTVARDDQEVLAIVQDIGDLANLIAIHGEDCQPDQLMIAELIGVSDILQLGRIDYEQHTAQLIGVVPVIEALELNQQSTLVPAGTGNCQRARRGRVRVEDSSRGQPQLGIIGTHLDGQFASNTVRPRDPADH